jgi:LacI family transcriptional regulator
VRYWRCRETKGITGALYDGDEELERMKADKPKSGRENGAVRSGRSAGVVRPATLHDVAAAAGVSAMTVSNFINSREGAMSPQTRARIEREIIRLGYRPHGMARSLRLSKRLSIGMIIIDDAPNYLADPFITYVVAGLSNQLNRDGYGLLLQGMTSRAFATSPVLRDIRTDGICVMLSGPDPARQRSIEALLGLRQPIVLIQDTLRFGGVDLCSIRQADRLGGKLLGREVAAAGARRAAMLVPGLHWPAIAERVKGVREGLRAAGGAPLRIIRCGDGEFRDTQMALASDIEENGLPDAVLAGNDQMGIAALKLVTARGLKVPRDVIVTGYNAFEFWQYTEPVLTTVRSPAYEIGARAGEAILGRLGGDHFDRDEIVLPVELQRGASV